jgi:hypothetical protein
MLADGRAVEGQWVWVLNPPPMYDIIEFHKKILYFVYEIQSNN